MIRILAVLGVLLVLGNIYYHMRSQPAATPSVETTITPERQRSDRFSSLSFEDIDLSAPSVVGSPPPSEAAEPAEATIDPEPAEPPIDPEPARSSDALPTETVENISFDQCIAMKARAFAQLNARPISIVSTKLVTIDRVCTAEGSVLISCSAPDRKMVITTSPSGGGC